MSWVKLHFSSSWHWERRIKGVVTHRARQISQNMNGYGTTLWHLQNAYTGQITKHGSLAEVKKAAAAK